MYWKSIHGPLMVDVQRVAFNFVKLLRMTVDILKWQNRSELSLDKCTGHTSIVIIYIYIYIYLHMSF